MLTPVRWTKNIGKERSWDVVGHWPHKGGDVFRMASQHGPSPKTPDMANVVDHTNLNKACPQDPFPLPHIDKLVDETTRCKLLSFMDVFKVYHQIFMAEEGDEKTTFMTSNGVYCYRMWPSG